MGDLQIVAGDIVQINPDSEGHFGGCLMIVESVRNWGLVGFFPAPDRKTYPYRAKAGTFERVGAAVWTKGERDE